MNKLLPVVLATLLCLTSNVVFAQSPWVETGTVDATIGGEAMQLSTFVTHVPEDVAEGIEDEAAREFAQRLAGTDQHTATWMVTDPIKAGEAVIMPAMMFVMISARVDADPSADSAQLDIDFEIDPVALELLPDAEITVTYYRESYDSDDYYALTQGTAVVDSIEPVGENVLAVTGTISGVLSHQDSYTVEHDPDDMMPIEATFQIEQVAGSSLLVDLLGE